MMPRPPGTVDPYKWTLDLPAGPLCSVGWSTNTLVSSDGNISNTGRPDEDRYYTCNFQDKVQLYMVLDGHDGVRACEFVQKHLPNVLLRCDLGSGGEAVKEALMVAFRNTEREFFKRIDPHIARKITLQIEISQKASNSIEAIKRFPDQVEEIERLDSQIKGGTTVAVAAIYNQKLYVANVGDTRVLLCSMTADGQLRAEQLSVDHNTSNDEELRRLAKCGLDPANLRRTKRVGTQQNSRSIGDYSIKGGYRDIDIISHATMEPGTAEPYICKSIDLSNFQGFLVLMSDGLYEAYESWTRRPAMVNQDIAHLIANEMKKTADISIVAQNVVEKVKSLFRSICQKDHRTGRLDDITLIVRNIGFPMPPGHSVSHPPDFVPGQIPGHPAGIMQSMSMQPTAVYSNYPQFQSYNPAATPGFSARVDPAPQYQTNIPDPQWQGGGRDGGVYYGGPVSMPYPQTDQYGRSVSFAPANVYYTSNQSTATSAMGVYQQSGYNTPTISTTAGYPTTDYQVPPQQQQDGSPTTTKHHHPVQHTKTEPSLQQSPPTKHGRHSVQNPPKGYYSSQSQVSPQHFQGTSTSATTMTTMSTQSNATATFQKKHEYENTKTNKMKTLQVDPRDKSQYVNVRLTNEDAQSKRYKRLSDSALEEKRVAESVTDMKKSQEHPPFSKADVSPSPQTPPAIRPKSADVSHMTANRTPDGKPIPTPRVGDFSKQKSVEKKLSSDELLELYGWLPTKTDSETSIQIPQQQPDSENCISFFNSGDLQAPPNPAPEPKKEVTEMKPGKEKKDKPVDSGSDDDDGVLVVNVGASSASGDEQEPLSGEFLYSYVKDWTMVPKDLSWDDITVNL